jgi:hypothetical protein
VSEYKIKVDFPNLPSGADVSIPGLPLELKNGQEYEVTKEEHERYRAFHMAPDEEGVWQPGPTLLQATKDDEYITVASPAKPAPTKTKEEVN